jgi:hypothetical protein
MIPYRYLNTRCLAETYGEPQIFLTWTADPHWQEVKTAVAQVHKGNVMGLVEDYPEILVRVFHLKLKALLDDIYRVSRVVS